MRGRVRRGLKTAVHWWVRARVWSNRCSGRSRGGSGRGSIRGSRGRLLLLIIYCIIRMRRLSVIMTPECPPFPITPRAMPSIMIIMIIINAIMIPSR